MEIFQRLRFEQHDHHGQTQPLSLQRQVPDHHLVAAMNAVEVADGDDAPALQLL